MTEPVSDSVMSAEEFLGLLDDEYFASYPEIDPPLRSLEDGEYDQATEQAAACLDALWRNYSNKNIALLLRTFPKVQKALFGLELDEETGDRYRDHFVHTFLVFAFGSAILSEISRQFVESGELDEQLAKWLRIEKERTEIPFSRYYEAKERLFFLWTLIATFHDVGIPVEHLDSVAKGLNNYLTHFGLELPDLTTNAEAAVSAKLDYYLRLMSKLYEGGIRLDETGERTYTRPDDPHPYVYTALARDYCQRRHGVVSAVCLYRSIEETFSFGRHEIPAYDLDSLDKYAAYNRHVIEEDITRAALAIALHSMPEEEHRNLFPLQFSEYPLACLLILTDELQEYYRLEGITLAGAMRMRRLPKIAVEVDTAAERIHIRAAFTYIRPSDREERAILGQAARWAEGKGESPPDDLGDLLNAVWKGIFARIKSRVEFSSPWSVNILVFHEAEDGSERHEAAHLQLPRI